MNRGNGCLAFTAGVMLSAMMAQAGVDGLRVVTWNISNYAGGRQVDLTTSIYGVFEGRSMDPDVLVVQEFISQSAVDTMLGILNNAQASPGDWAAAPFVNGPDTDGAMFYRTSKVEFLGLTILPADPGTTGAPRDVQRYDIGLVGYAAPASQIAIYNSHMKAGSSSSDQARRLIEAQKIRTNAETLDLDVNIMLVGDFNIQSSNQAAYQHLIATIANYGKQFADPIGTPGSWNNNFAFRFVHTQDPIGAGGMDDRHDQILVDPSFGDGVGLEYRGAFGVPYSTTTWDDPNHSYRSWGNDGTSFDLALRTVGNTMVGEAIAIALRNVATSGGHLPVFADFIVPGKIFADTVIDLGSIPVGSVVQGTLNVGNGGNVALWGPTGVGSINYVFDADPGIVLAAGPFADEAGGTLNEHEFAFELAVDHPGGPVSAEVRVISDDVDQPVVTIVIQANVLAGCSPADLALPFGVIDFFDAMVFLQAFSSNDPLADLNDDGEFNFFDAQLFLQAFAEGCP